MIDYTLQQWAVWLGQQPGPMRLLYGVVIVLSVFIALCGYLIVLDLLPRIRIGRTARPHVTVNLRVPRLPSFSTPAAKGFERSKPQVLDEARRKELAAVVSIADRRQAS